MSAVKMQVINEMDVVDVALCDIKLWKDNPRRNDAAVPRLMELLREHGQRTPIVLWRKNMTIYKGNTTFKAAVKLKWKTIKCILADFPSEQAAIAYGISDNKSSEFAGWDDKVLARLLKSDLEYFNQARTGFSEQERDLLTQDAVV
jgi:site-specific DNA-methyltransferase (adenine-specific)